jgi:hypothetical protein
MIDRIKLLQGQDYSLAGGGIGIVETSITIDDFVLPNSNERITMSMFGEKGYATLEPETQREENISFTGVTYNGNSKSTLTGVVRGLPFASTASKADYNTPDALLIQPHAGGSVIRITNSVSLLQWFANKRNDENIEGQYNFPDNPGTLRPTLTSDTNAVLSRELITKGELNRAIGNEFLTPTIVNVSKSTSGTNQVSSINWNHTVSGKNRLLSVQISSDWGTTITGVTYNGVALTQAVSKIRATGLLRSEIWYLIAPATGTHSVVVTASGISYISGIATTLNSVDQTSPLGITGSADGSSTTPSVSITTIQDNSLIIDSVATANDPIVFTAGSGQAIIDEIASSATKQIASSVEDTDTAGSYTASYTISPSTNWAITAVEYKGVTGSANLEVQENGITIATNVSKINVLSDSNIVTNPATGEAEIDLTNIGGGGGTKIEINTTQYTQTNNTSEQTAYTVSLPTNILGTTNGIKVTIPVSSYNQNGGNDTTVRLKLDGTTIGTVVMDSGTGQGTLDFLILADNSSTAQKTQMRWDPEDGTIAVTDSTSTVNTSGSVSLTVTVQYASSGNTFVAQAIVVESINSISIAEGQFETMTANEDITIGQTVGVSNNISGSKVSRANRFNQNITTAQTQNNSFGLNNPNASCPIGGDKFAYLLADASDDLYVYAGDVDTDTLTSTLGTGQLVTNDLDTGGTGTKASICKLDTDKFIVLYVENASSTIIKYRIGTVGVGNAITLGAAATFTTASSAVIVITSDYLSTDKAVMAYGCSPTHADGRVITFTTTGTSTNVVGTPATMGTNTRDTLGIMRIKKTDTDTFLLATSSTYAQMGTCIGTTNTTMGSEVQFTTSTPATTYGLNIAVQSNVLVTISIELSASAVEYVAGAISGGGTVIAFGTPVAGVNNAFSIYADSTTSFIAQLVSGTSGIRRYTISGTAIVLDKVIILEINNYMNFLPIDNGYYTLIAQTNTTFAIHIQGMSNSFMGIAQATVSKGATVSVLYSGKDANQASLVAGGIYEPNGSGGITLISSTSTSYVAGKTPKMKALNTTTIIV